MSQTLVLEIPDTTWAELQRSAQARHQSPEETVMALLTHNLADPLESDPLIRLFGTVQSDITDGAARHDEYIGAAIFRETHRE